jgi:hypothetical protein
MADGPPLDDLIGRRVFRGGYEYAIRYSPESRSFKIEQVDTPGAFEALLDYLRGGACVLRMDPADLERDSFPVTRWAMEREILVLEGALEGGKLSPELQLAVEVRLEALWSLIHVQDPGWPPQ